MYRRFRSSTRRKKALFYNRPKKDKMNPELPLTCQYGKAPKNMVGKKGEIGTDSDRESQSWERNDPKKVLPTPPTHKPVK